MYAIVEIAGQQFKVTENQKVFVHRLAAEEGKKVTFDNVLLLDDEGKVTVGTPEVPGAAVEAKVVKHLKGDKVIVFKKKRRKGYRVKNGHRQFLTQLTIENIIASGAKKAIPAEVSAETTETIKAETPATEEKAAPQTVAEPATEDLSKKTVAALREMARAKGISGISTMKKAELIAALSK